MKLFADVASTQPQLIYAAFTRSLQHEWSYLLRVIPQSQGFFQNLEQTISSVFLPAVFGVEISSTEQDLFALPLRMSGLGVSNPVVVAPYVPELSVQSTNVLVRSIAHATVFELDAHIDAVLQAKAQYRQLMGDVSASNFDVFCSPLLMPPVSVLRIVICHPGWLCCLCTGISSIYLPKNFAIAWLYATISPCCVYRLHVMVVVLHLLLLTLWIAALEVW